MALGNERAFNANVTYEVLFNDPDSDEGSGVSDMWLYGNGRMMADMDVQAPPTKNTGSPANSAPLSCNVDLHMSFNEGFFHGNMDVYLNAGILKGSGPNNQLGWAEIHMAPGFWYIKMGKPYYGEGDDLRLGMDIDVPGFGNIAGFRSYLQIGMDLDPMPPLPENIANLTGLHGSIAPQRDGMAIGGNGFIFGAELNLGGNNYNFAIFEATLAADLGFDVSVLDYGSDAFCSNTGSPLGINGWYAMGQVYAGLEIGVDIKVKVFGKTKRFTIFDMAGAAALQAMLPNPFWARGGVGIDYNLLNGLVKGHCDFQFEIGEQCQLVGGTSPYENVPVINLLTPADSSQSVSVRITPRVSFNFPVEKDFTMVDFGGNNVTYRVEIDEAKVVHPEWDVPAQWEFKNDNRELLIVPNIILPKYDTFELRVKVHVDSSGVNVHEEEQTVMFTTGGFISAVWPNNVAGSYPLNGQYNFYKKEITSGQGYIQLEKGQPDLFFEDEERYLVVRFRKGGGSEDCTISPAQYEFFENRVVFDLPISLFRSRRSLQNGTGESALSGKWVFRRSLCATTNAKSKQPGSIFSSSDAQFIWRRRR